MNMNKTYQKSLGLTLALAIIISASVEILLSDAALSSEDQMVPTDVKMKPVLPENKKFNFGTGSSNQVTPYSLSLLNYDFFNSTGGSPEVKDKRNTGTIKLNLLVREVLYNTIPNAERILNTKDKEEISNEILTNYLERHFPAYVDDFKKNGSLNVTQVSAVSDRIREEIMLRVQHPPERRGQGGKLRAQAMMASGGSALVKRLGQGKK